MGLAMVVVVVAALVMCLSQVLGACVGLVRYPVDGASATVCETQQSYACRSWERTVRQVSEACIDIRVAPSSIHS